MKVLDGLKFCSQFMGLCLNLSKTVAFDPIGSTPMDLGIQVTNKPIKYLGVYLGIDDLVKNMNFELIKSKMKIKIDHWRNRIIILQAHILVVKVLLFSCCTHVLNVIYISSKHLDQPQHMLNEFLWCGKNKMQQASYCQLVSAGGLKF